MSEEKKPTDEDIAQALLQNIEYGKTITYFDKWGNRKSIAMTDVLNLIQRVKDKNEQLMEENGIIKGNPPIIAGRSLGKTIRKKVHLFDQMKERNEELQKQVNELTEENNILSKVIESSKRKTKILELQKEIERLTEELEVKKKECREIADDYQEMGTFYYNETVKTAELQKQVEQLLEERVTINKDYLQECKEHLKTVQIVKELQKQVDGLTDKLGKVWLGVKADELLVAKGIEHAVKDAAKEIFMEILRRMKKLKDMFESPFGDYRESKEHLVATIDIEIMGIKNLAKQFGVEVE